MTSPMRPCDGDRLVPEAYRPVPEMAVQLERAQRTALDNGERPIHKSLIDHLPLVQASVLEKFKIFMDSKYNTFQTRRHAHGQVGIDIGHPS